jgi:hypothetical protein
MTAIQRPATLSNNQGCQLPATCGRRLASFRRNPLDRPQKTFLPTGIVARSSTVIGSLPLSSASRLGA